jgi:hypothetical protein
MSEFRDWQQNNEYKSKPFYWGSAENEESADQDHEENEERKNRHKIFDGGE